MTSNKSSSSRPPVRHDQPNPFPMSIGDMRTGTDVPATDERCRCGDLRSDHFDTLAFGHGPCSACRVCSKFTWVGFVQAGQKGGAA